MSFCINMLLADSSISSIPISRHCSETIIPQLRLIGNTSYLTFTFLSRKFYILILNYKEASINRSCKFWVSLTFWFISDYVTGKHLMVYFLFLLQLLLYLVFLLHLLLYLLLQLLLQLSLKLSIWILIISQHNPYVQYAAWCALSSPALWFAIGSTFVELLWNKAENPVKITGFS